LLCFRSKRKLSSVVQPDYPHHHIPSHPTDSSSALQIHQAAAAAAAAAVTYSATATPPYNCNMLYNNYTHPSTDYSTQQNFYHTNFENRYLENSLFPYRPYYPDYNTAAATTWGCLYGDPNSASNCTTDYKSNYTLNHHHQQSSGGSSSIVEKKPELKSSSSSDYLSHYTNGTSASSVDTCQLPRQTVLMWAHQSSGRQNGSNSSAASIIHHQPQYEKKYSILDPLKSLSGVISTVDTPTTAPTEVVVDTASAVTAKSLYLQGYSGAEEVWHPSHHPHSHQ
jgi:hypothetical protein